MRIILGSYNLIEINLALIVDFMPDLITVISYRLSVHLGQGIQERTKENLWKTAFKNVEGVWSA